MEKDIEALADRMWRIHPNDISALGLRTRTEYYKMELENFARLITGEIIDLIDQSEGDLDYAKFNIKKRFGVT